MTAPLWSRSATWLATAIRERQVSSLEAVDACLARIERSTRSINAVVRLADDARDRARAADAALARGDATGPLHGIPFTIKDSMDTAGVVTTAGTVGWRDRVPDRDATVVARLRAAGGILVGKTNTPEFTWSNETDNDVYGRTSNPYDLGRTPGGSSGGAASIVAAGGSPFDIGSDSGDSIRQPAHLCGVAGIKPTSGRVPRTGPLAGPGWPVRVVHAARADRAAGRGPRSWSCRSSPAPTARTRTSCRCRSATLARWTSAALRVAWFGDNGIRTPTPETLDAVEAARSRPSARPARPSEEHLPADIADARPAWEAVIRADGFAWLWRLIEAAGTPGHGSFDTFGWVAVRPGEPLAGDALTAAVEHADAVRGRLLRWVRAVRPARLPGPAAAGGPPRREHGPRSTATRTARSTTSRAGRPPSCAAGTSPEGLPIGVQLVAKPWREDVALAAARVVEAATGGWQAPALEAPLP